MGIRRKTLGVSAALTMVITGLGLPMSAGADGDATQKAPPRAQEGQSCWYEIDTGNGLCVATGDDLIAAIAEEKGVRLVIPGGEIVSGLQVGSRTHEELSDIAPAATYAISVIYDDVNYGGSSYTMTTSNSTACQYHAYGFVDIGGLGWYGRVSAYKSYSGCRTAVFENTGYGGSSHGYFTNASSLGVMNDKAKSWRVID